MSSRLTFALALEGMEPKEGRPLQQVEYCVELYHGREGNDDWGDCVQMTEPIMGESSPKFTPVFGYDWTMGEGQLWRFLVVEKFVGGNKTNVEGQAPPVVVKVDEYVQRCREEVGAVRFPLYDDKGGSLVLLPTEPFRFRLSGKNIPHKGAFGTKSDPYVECYWKRGTNGEYHRFHKTKYVKWSENPDWDEVIDLPIYVKDEPMMFKFRVLDRDPLTPNEYIGEVEVHAAKLFACAAGETLTVKMTGDKKGEAELNITLVWADK